MTTLAACSAGKQGQAPTTGDAPAGPAATDGSRDPATEQPPPIPPEDIPECASTGNLELAAAKTKVMVLLDGSNSMEAHWPAVRGAVEQMITENPSAEFGIHMFYAEGDVWGVFDDANFCGESMHPRVEVGPNQAATVLQAMGPRPPGAGNRFIDTSPVMSGLNWYLEHDTPLTDPQTTNYLVVISDFRDNCFGTLFATTDAISNAAGQENLYAYEKIAVELRKRNMRVIPIGFDAQGNMQGNMAGTDLDALRALTEFGGTDLKEPILADDAASLTAALQEVSKAVRPCRFRIPSSVDNAFRLSFYIDGQLIERDRTRVDGWDFVTGGTDEVEFHGSACEALQDRATLGAVLGCEDDDVCATAATKISFKDRAMHILLDGSASMGLDNFGSVIIGSITGGTTELTGWGYATAALSGMVTSPINDDMEFGFQLFPKGASGGCEVGPPEVPVGAGTEISIVHEMVSKVPTGRTPLLAALQYVRDHPGRLAEDGVVGSLLVVGDGANDAACEPRSDDVVRELAETTRAIANLGIDVYPVQFSKEPSAEQIAQMQAIALNGRADGSDGQVLEAPDGQALTEVLEQISRGLASCNLEVGDLPGNVDPEKVNIYLDGILAPYAQGGDPGDGSPGWTWVLNDDGENDYSEVVFFGQACEQLQNGRLTNIVMELGCETVIIQ